MSSYFDIVCLEHKQHAECSINHGENMLYQVIRYRRALEDIQADAGFAKLVISSSDVTLDWFVEHTACTLWVKCEYESFEACERRFHTCKTWAQQCEIDRNANK